MKSEPLTVELFLNDDTTLDIEEANWRKLFELLEADNSKTNDYAV